MSGITPQPSPAFLSLATSRFWMLVFRLQWAALETRFALTVCQASNSSESSDGDMRHITIHAEDEVKRSCQCTGCSISPNSSYSSHLRHAAERQKSETISPSIKVGRHHAKYCSHLKPGKPSNCIRIKKIILVDKCYFLLLSDDCSLR